MRRGGSLRAGEEKPMTATVMAEGLRFPEGPVVYPDGSVIVVEILGGALTRVWGDGRKEGTGD